MIYLKLILTAFFWGGTFIAGRMIAGVVDPVSAAFLRFAIASVFLLVFTVRLEGRLPGLTRHQVLVIASLGLTGVFGYNLFFFSGLKYIQANQAALIIATNPIFISLSAALFLKENLNRFKIAGLLLSVCGALIVITNGHPTTLFTMGIGRGELLIFGCVASWVAYSIIGKAALKDMSPITSVAYSAVAGTLFLLLPALNAGLPGNLSTYTLPQWASLFYLGFFGTVLGFYWYYQGIQAIGPTRAGMFINFVPASAIVLSFFILKEPLTLSLVTGAAFVITGVWLANRPG